MMEGREERGRRDGEEKERGAHMLSSLPLSLPLLVMFSSLNVLALIDL